MFVAWQRKPLSARGIDDRSDCPHPPEGLSRETIKPIVRVAFRIDGKPRNRVIARPGDAVRRCCLEAENPVALGRFWASVRRRANEATLRIGLAREVYDPLELELWRDRHSWLWAELARVVRQPTADESRLYDLFERDEPLPAPAAGAAHADRLEAARARLAAYLKTKRRGEMPHEWWLRTEPPPGYDRKRAARERDADAALFAEAFGRLHHGVNWRAQRGSWKERLEAFQAQGEAPVAARVLGLPWPCSAAELKAAWRRAALASHPDRGGTDEAFRTAKEAHETLAAALRL